MSIQFKGHEKIWFDGKIVDFDEAKIHVLSHVVHYGSSIFEGGRCYATPKGPGVFRLADHVERLFNGVKVYRMDQGENGLKFTKEDMANGILEVVRVNGFQSCYLRPIVFRGFGTLGVLPFGSPMHMVIAACEMGDYLEGAADGVEVQVSTWTRMAPNTFPAQVKSGANYMNSQLIKMEAVLNGVVEGIALDTYGYVCEGSGENIFIVRNGKLITPPVSASILMGITRDSILTLARDLGLEIIERQIAREELYMADEVFFTGSAAEVTPIVKIDKIQIGTGKPGEVAMALKTEFFKIINMETEDRHGWLTIVE
ncbi:MAG: branched-chain amino acid transaminase [Gemmatimonadetes bacterium]|nr:MAG: branched-chain amino acid transaminase [Gemmatimonadota bacterium]